MNQNQQERALDKDCMRGTGKQVKGSIKEAIGKVTGNKRTEVEGTAERIAGKAQSEVGKAKDAVRDVLKK
jgi:uncharacterized protein YjbJ (UPF0337 family)